MYTNVFLSLLSVIFTVANCLIWGNVSFPPLILNTKPDPNETLTVRVQTEPLPVETVQNLKSQTPYRFASRAWNWFKGAQHAGDWSDWSEEIQLCGEVPEKVSSFLTKTREAGNFNLEWEEPSDNGLDINRYIVNYCKCTNVDRENSLSGKDPCFECNRILGGAGKEKKCYNAVEIDEAGLQDSIKSKTKSMEEGTSNQLDISEPDNLIPAYYYAMIICACNRQGCGLPSRVLNDKVQETGLKMGKVTLEDSNDISIVTLITNENTTTAYYVSLDVDAHSKNTTVIVNIASDNEHCQIEPTSVTFSQTTDGIRIPDAYKIEVEVGGNLIDEGDGKPFADCKITHTIDSNDIYYISSQPSYLEVRVNNDDIADTKLRPAEAYDDEEVVKFEPFYLKFLGPITVAEGVSQVYGIQLESEPIQPVYINIGVTKPRPATPTEVILSTSKLAFNRSNWNEIQIVEIFVMDDDVDSKMDVEDFYLNHLTESLDPVYAAKALNMTVVVRVEDDDEAGVTFDSEDVIEVSEGKTGVSFQIMKLKTRPLDDVTLMLTSSQPLLKITPDSIFVSINNALDLNASVTVEALEGNYRGKTSAIISVTSTSKDPKYESQVKFSRTVAINTKKFTTASDCNDDFFLNITDLNPRYHYCQPCPQGASCRGPVVFKQVVSLFGWSRCPNDRTKFERCNFPAACLGASNPTFYGKFKGDPAKNNTKEACHYAYVNNSLLCGACNSEFSHSDLSGKCSTCPKLWRNILLGFLGVLAGVVLIVLYINMTLSDHGSIDAADSLLPIGLSYVQVISLLVTFPIAWPQIFVSIFQVGGAVTVLGQHMVNLKCMTDTQTDASVFYAQRVVWVIMPPFILGVNSMTWMILYRKCTSFQLKNKTIQHKNKLNAIKGSNVALLYLLWPSLCSQTFALFSCQGICNSQVLRAE